MLLHWSEPWISVKIYGLGNVDLWKMSCGEDLWQLKKKWSQDDVT